MLYVISYIMLLLYSCIVLYCSYACCLLFVLVLCIVFMHTGMEERLCRMPEFKHINQIKSNQIKSTTIASIVTYIYMQLSCVRNV